MLPRRLCSCSHLARHPPSAWHPFSRPITPSWSAPAAPHLQAREQEDAHDFLEFLVDRMHQELAALTRSGGAGQDGAAAAAVAASPAAAAAAADAAQAAAEDEWLTKSGRRVTKRQQLRSDSETAVSLLFRGTTLRWAGGWPGAMGVWLRCVPLPLSG